MKDKNLILKISTEMKLKLQQEADRRGMSMSTLVRMAVVEFIDKKEV